MRKFSVIGIILLLSLFATSACADTDNFLGIKYDGTSEQCSEMTLLPDGSRGNPSKIYYRSDNLQLEGKDLGSVYFGFNKCDNKFYSADARLLFFNKAKRSKAIKMQDGTYQMMGKIELADEYYKMLCEYFSKDYGAPQESTQTSGSAEIKMANWNSPDGIFVQVSTGRIEAAQQTYVGINIIKTR